MMLVVYFLGGLVVLALFSEYLESITVPVPPAGTVANYPRIFNRTRNDEGAIIWVIRLPFVQSWENQSLLMDDDHYCWHEKWLIYNDKHGWQAFWNLPQPKA